MPGTCTYLSNPYNRSRRSFYGQIRKMKNRIRKVKYLALYDHQIDSDLGVHINTGHSGFRTVAETDSCSPQPKLSSLC